MNDAPVATDVPDAEADEDVPRPLTRAAPTSTRDSVTVASATDPANGTATIDGPNAVDLPRRPELLRHRHLRLRCHRRQRRLDTGTVRSRSIRSTTRRSSTTRPSRSTRTRRRCSASSPATSTATSCPGASPVAPPRRAVRHRTGRRATRRRQLPGTDTFAVQVSDGSLTASATMTVTVAPVNDQPVAYAEPPSTNEDEAIAHRADGLRHRRGHAHLRRRHHPDQRLRRLVAELCKYSPNPNFNGSDLFTFTSATARRGRGEHLDHGPPVNDDPVVSGVRCRPPRTPRAVPLTATDVDRDALSFAYGAATSGVVAGGGPDAVFSPTRTSTARTLRVHRRDGQGGSTARWSTSR